MVLRRTTAIAAMLIISLCIVNITVVTGGTFNLPAGNAPGYQFNLNSVSFTLTEDLNNSGLLSSTTGTISIKGDWENNGSFNSGSGVVSLDGAGTQAVTTGGSESAFNILNINNSHTEGVTFSDALYCSTINAVNDGSAAKKLSFSISGEHTITTLFNVNGTSGAPDNLIELSPETPGADWSLNTPSTTLNYVDVSHSLEETGNLITAYNSTDSGNNANWRVFEGGPAHETSLNIPAGYTVKADKSVFNIPGTINNTGTLEATTGSISLLGDWNNAGTFNSGSSTVLLNSDTQTQAVTTGGVNSKFYELRIENSGTPPESGVVMFVDTLYCDILTALNNGSGVNQLLFSSASITEPHTIFDFFNVNGSSGNLITLGPLAPETDWYFDAPEETTVNYVDVSYSQQTNEKLITALNSVNSGNNSNWNISGTGIINRRPVANAGSDQTGAQYDVITLNASKSADVDGNFLTYKWTSVGTNTATLNDSTAVFPTFTMDTAGRYDIELTVFDGSLYSDPDTVIIGTQTAPVANAGADQTGTVSDDITLNGSGSSDVDCDLLNYQWSLIQYSGTSSPTLHSSTSIFATFTANAIGTYTAQLVVNDGTGNNDTDTVFINIDTQSAPVANAGPDQTATSGDITLAGFGTDVDGDVLTYKWSLIKRPDLSSAQLSVNQDIPGQPTFTIDEQGTYIAQLIVNDGARDSEPDTVVISGKTMPFANAGYDHARSIGTNTVVTLQGVDSVNVSQYNWCLIHRPPASNASIEDPASPLPSFTYDKAGDYLAQLIVSNGGIDSEPDTSVISLQTMPVAHIVGTATAIVDETITLDGSGSWDDDGDNLTHSWSITSYTGSSTPTLNNPGSETVNFVITETDVSATVQLIVNDGTVDGAAKCITITTLEDSAPPVAIAGVDNPSVTVDSTVSLNATGSYDPDGDSLSEFEWVLDFFNGTSTVSYTSALSDASASNPTFTADAEGCYTAKLRVMDVTSIWSAPSSIVISAVGSVTAAIATSQSAISDIAAGTMTASFKNPKIQDKYGNILQSVITLVDTGKYDKALKKTRNNLLNKINGCAETPCGCPEGDDWIDVCEGGQDVIYPQLKELEDQLITLLQ